LPEERTVVDADVVVVGFGAAGACAALEARAAGASVVIVERFTGGGATALSGGVVYAGGGTAPQQQAGVADTVAAMFDYLSVEVGDAVTPATLEAFCAQSAAMVQWLAGHGVRFDGSLCREKTSYPPRGHYLYYSGSERSFGHVAEPAPRGHRAVGRGVSGRALFGALAAAVARTDVTVLTQTAARQLVTDQAGRVTGVDCLTLNGAPAWAAFTHRILHKVSKKPYLYLPKLGRVVHRRVAWLEGRYGRPLRITARGGLVLAAGGFAANRAMMREHAPAYRGGLALATPGDDGTGIRLGTEAGAATRLLDRVSVWRFISPPPALVHGIIVDKAGQRVCDESRYGAAIGDAMVSRHGGRAWLLADRPIVAAARRELRRSAFGPRSALWFQTLQGWYLLTAARVSAPTVAQAASLAGVDPPGLAATLDAYNSAVAAGQPDAQGKPADQARAINQPPYSLIDLSVRPRPAYPAPMLTLGGLVVAEQSGQVLRRDGSAIGGLYAAGRTAVGLCSSSYVSGLSLADCVFSGRRAGQHAALGAPGTGRIPDDPPAYIVR
jgi:3-oxo-5alpha-steroid 4-dehydrogenase